MNPENVFNERSQPPPDLAPQAASVLDSDRLFGLKKLVWIRHNGDWYRLMVTRQNKLILTK